MPKNFSDGKSSQNLKILNLYAGIGGNRKLWDEVANIEVTAVEIKEEIAEVYHDFFPQDEVIVGDAHEYLKENYENYDFIWSSPPCPTHSRVRNELSIGMGQNRAVYPDMELYEEILLLKQVKKVNGTRFNGHYCIENVISYYNPLIKPQEVNRHYFWSDFFIPLIKIDSIKIRRTRLENIEKKYGFNLSDYNGSISKKKILRNCVHPKLGKHILESAYKNKVEKLEAFA